ncbi:MULTISPECIES: hypothetical protein [Hymenobacter]|uniref:Uncharacterized protein n=1 Tax=Hymenobacter mucosus TaxID=1411120 RepID=A0A238Y096_9BACT|nr:MULTISPECIES: hypothetical protein [Hymenobacter]SNR64390.1 hypothetical protein SAMN06269173_104526 [Hymenobacter mucosus]
MTIPTYLRALGLFYRTVAPFTVVFSLLIFAAAAVGPFPTWPLPLTAGLLLTKLGTFLVIWYLSAQLRPHQYWFYLNLHIAPWQLWAGVLVADTLLFSAAVGLLHAVLQ